MRPLPIHILVLAALCVPDIRVAVAGAERVGAENARPSASDDAWWHQMFSMSFDGHGNFVVPHLDTLNTTAASMGAMGFHGVWDADLNRDMPWMRGHLEALAKHPGVRRVLYIEGCGASKVLYRASADGRILFTSGILGWLNDPARRDYVARQIKPGGSTGWFGDWQFMHPHGLKTSQGNPLPTARDLGLPPFVHPLDGSEITAEEDFWRTRSARPLIGDRPDGAEEYVTFSDADARALGLESVTTRREDGQWIVKSEANMLYDAQFARYQAAKARRAMEVFAPDMIHYDDWDLRSPTAMNARADIHVAAFRKLVSRRFSEEDCRNFGFERGRVADFDVLRYLMNPPWRGEYKGEGDGPLWRCATDPRWLSDKVWRAFQIACIEDRLASMREVYRSFKRSAREVLGRDVPMVANIIPTLGALFLQRDCVDMSNLEWPMFKTYGVFPKPLGYYPEARLGIGPRMASKIGVTGHAIVDPYVEPQYSGWSGGGFTNRHYETLHKVIYFDLVANRGIPAFALTWDGGYSPGSIHSAGQLHSFMNEVAPVISRRDYIADIGLAASAWSPIAAQPPFGGWQGEVTKRYLSEFLGWSQYLGTSREFWQWDVLPLDGVTLDQIARFRLVILPSVLVVSDDHLAVLERYLQRGGKLLVTGESGAFQGPENFLMPHPNNALEGLAKKYPEGVRRITLKPGLDHHMTHGNDVELCELIRGTGLTQPVLTATGAPEHVGIYLNESRTAPGEVTLDLVNYNYDLSHDTMAPVPSADFRVQVCAKHVASMGGMVAESIRYDECQPHNVARQALGKEAVTLDAGTLTIHVPAFEHYQIIRIAGARE